MQPPGAPGGHDHGTRAHEHEATPLEVVDHGPGASPMVVGQQLDHRAAVPHCHVRLQVDRLAQHTHHLKAGVVAVREDARRRGAARLLAQQLAAEGLVAVFEVEMHAQADQPADDVGAIHRHLRDELGFGAEVPRAQRVFEVPLRAVVGADCGLDAAFCHHRVAVAQAQLGGEHHLGTFLGRGERRSTPCAATADDQYIGAHELRAGNVDIVDEGVGMKLARHIGLAWLAAIHPDGKGDTCVGAMVGVVALEQFVDGRGIAAQGRRGAGVIALARNVVGDAGRHAAVALSAGRAPRAHRSQWSARRARSPAAAASSPRAARSAPPTSAARRARGGWGGCVRGTRACTGCT